MVDTGARQYALEEVLLQGQELMRDADNDEKKKEWVTIRYWSKIIFSAARNYSTTQSEFL